MLMGGLLLVVGCTDDGQVPAEQPDAGSGASLPELTIVVDNEAVDPSLTAIWGYSCLVRNLSRPVLFDTGAGEEALLDNMAKLAIDPGSLDLAFLSHDHGDHTEGLVPFLQTAPPTDLYLLATFSAALQDAAVAEGATLHEVEGATAIVDDVHSLGAMGMAVPEHALVIDTQAGLVVLTGCAHPGIAEIVSAARQAFSKAVLLVMGGFHLYEATTEQIDAAVQALADLGVQFVAPSHCTGELAREAFAQAFGSGYLAVGAGSTITLADLVP